MTRPSPLPLTVSEAQLQGVVIDTARLYRCQVHHSRPGRVGDRWVTPLQGHPGLPDLVIARDGWVLLAELKRHRGRVSPAQRAWLQALGRYGVLWGPEQWNDGTILDVLQHGPAGA